MSNCAICRKSIEPGTAAVSIVGGQFPREEPDFFMVDETVLTESHAHLPCLLGALSTAEESSQTQ
jgi:hypothetical protein